MDLNTAGKVLPCLLSPQVSFRRVKIRRMTPSPEPLRFNSLYRELIQEQKAFLQSNRFAQLNSPKHLRPSLLPKSLSPDHRKPRVTTGLDIAGLPVLLRSQEKPILRSMLDCYRPDRSWLHPAHPQVSALPPKSLPKLKLTIDRIKTGSGMKTEAVQCGLDTHTRRPVKLQILPLP